MSLIKQLWLAVIFIMSLAFTASFVINTLTSKHYLEQQLELKNTDNAVSLALSISQMKKDPVAINLMISAQFDNGHYQYIKLLDVNQKPITERIGDQHTTGAPHWFTQLVSIKPAPGIAQIQDGWSQYGTIVLASATNFAYQDLWNGTTWMLLWSVIIAIICGIIGSMLHRMIVRPLHEMVAMAEAIGDKNFMLIKEPDTQEFKSLAQGMNRLSGRIKTMLHDQAQLLDQMRIEANYDTTTGLMNRRYFSNRVATHIAQEENFTEGLLVICRISNLAEINQKLGNVETDIVLKRMGFALKSFCEPYPSLLAGRLTGADFAVFSTELLDANILCGQIKHILHTAANLEQAFPNFQLPTTSSKIGKSEQLHGLKQVIAAIKAKTHHGDADIMSLIDQAKMTRYEDSDETEWRTMLTDAIKQKRIKLATFPVMTTAGDVIHHESPVRLQFKADGLWHPAAEFIGWATQLGLVTQLDDLVLETAMAALEAGATPIGLNISTGFMTSPESLAHMQSILKKHPQAATQLWLEISEQGAFQNLPQFKAFCTLAKSLGCKIGVEHVGAQISRLGELHDLALDYIKIDASIIRDIGQNTGNQAYLKGICLIAHSLGLIAIAEGVQTAQELAILPTLGIDAMTGPAVKAV